ncbi:MAG: hypothetical protein ACTHNW_19725 [Mucilaginibacter sp.]
MSDEKFPLKTINHWINPDYINKIHTYCIPTIKSNSKEYPVGNNKFEISLDISIKFYTKDTNVLVMDSNFNQFYEVQLTDKSLLPTDRLLFQHRIFQTFGDINLYLQSNVPLGIFEITPLLLAGGEKVDLADDIFEKLTIHLS